MFEIKIKILKNGGTYASADRSRQVALESIGKCPRSA
jgi:hypothetical protein